MPLNKYYAITLITTLSILLTTSIQTVESQNTQNVILQATQSLTATSSIGAAFLSHHHRNTQANNVGHLSGNMRLGKFLARSAINQSWADESTGRDGYANLIYQGRIVQPYFSLFFVDSDFVNRLGYHPFTGYRGVSLGSYLQNEWREGFIRRASISIQSEASNTYEGEIFRRSLNVSSLILTHSDYALAAGWRGGLFEEFNDSVFSIGLRARASSARPSGQQLMV